MRSKKIWIAVIYLFFPIDLVPDLIPVVGLFDDIAVLAYAFMSKDQTAAT